MTNVLPAIYENGVLRPLTPLYLPDKIHVQVVVVPLFEDYPPVQMREDEKPTMSELLAQLREINKIEPIELDLPPRQDRPNPLLEMPDEFFV